MERGVGRRASRGDPAEHVQMPTKDVASAKSRGQAESWEGAQGHRHPPPHTQPQGSVTVMIEHISHIIVSGQHEGGKA